MRRSGVFLVVLIGVLAVATRAFAATAPTITSAASATFNVGTSGSFVVTTTGDPPMTIARTGDALPSGVTLTDKTPVDGKATLTGTPAVGTEGTYHFTFTATNATSPAATQSFTLTVGPLITSASSTTFTVGTAGTFTVTAAGSGVTLTKSGTLPSAVTFTDNGSGTATIAGTPAAGTEGTYPITITAANATGGSKTQAFALIVAARPASTCQTLDANQSPRTRFLRGDRFFVKGVLPGASGTVNILFNNSANIGSGKQNEDGSYLVAARVPLDAGFGGNTVVAKKLTVSATCGINVVPLSGAAAAATATPRPATVLPKTGSPILPLGVAGLLFLGTGTGMLLYYRRQAFALLSVVWTEADVFFAREENRVKSLFTGLVRKIRR